MKYDEDGGDAPAEGGDGDKPAEGGDGDAPASE